jgi:glutamate---cysteine ligase / carboxylate-amine ligase
MSDGTWRLFERFGIELEYMIVDAQTLGILPIADRMLVDRDGQPQSDLAAGPLTWSNELVLHVLELKTEDPAPSLHGLAGIMHAEVRKAVASLADHGATLLPGAMHPTMDPVAEMRLWPHDNGEIYAAFNRIFDCRGHGWANLQSTHINLPFGDDEEFRRLHAAIRVTVPLLPALAASSPIMDGAVTPWLDSRLEVYRHNAARVPSVSGAVIPEAVSSEGEYRDRILGRIYADLEPLDPEGLLREEWVNARGAIARFQRNTIEIRVLDIQECPAADLAIAAATSAIVRRFTNEATASIDALDAMPTERLARILEATIRDGERARIEDREFLGLYGWTRGSIEARDLWDRIIDDGLQDGPDRLHWERALEHILARGCLARRILEHAGPQPSRAAIANTCRALADCLQRNAQLGRD